MKHRTPATYLAAAALSVLVILGIVQCGGSGSTAPAAIAISGSVLAPGGSIALLERKSLPARMFAALIPNAEAQSSTLQPVVGTNVYAFAVDPTTGAATGSPLASTTTDGSGNYSFNLPAGTSLGSNIIVQATPNSSPVTCTNTAGTGCSTPAQGCPATRRQVDLTPATEYATRAVLAYIVANSSTLANFTVAEINAIVDQVVTAAQDPSLVGATLQDTINNITAVVDQQTQATIGDASTAGEVTAPTGMGGTYNLIQFEYEPDQQNVRQLTGTVSVNVSGKTFSASASGQGNSLSGSCGVNGPCDVTFTLGTGSGTTDNTSGSFTLLNGNRIAFQPADNSTGAIGSYSSAGDIILIPSESGLIVLIKQTSQAPTLSGAYGAGSVDAELFTSSGSPSTNNGFSISNTTITIASGSFTGSDSGTSMSMQAACTDNGNNTCTSSNTMNTPGSHTNQAISGTVSASSSGVLTLTPAQDITHTGAVSSSGNFFAFADGDISQGNGGVVAGVKQPTNMAIGDLDGDYAFAALGVDLDTGGSGSIQTDSEGGSITLNNGSLDFNSLSFRRQAQRGCPSCNNPSALQSSKNESATGITYTVGQDGAVSVAAPDPLTGFASADGKVVVLTQARDGSSGGGRALYIFVR